MSESPRTKHRRPGNWSRRRWATTVVIGLIVAVGVGLGVVQLSSSPTTPPAPARLIAMYDSGVPGTPAATAALEFASRSHIDWVINYSFINAPIAAEKSYLLEAQRLNVGIVPSLCDLLATTPKLALDPNLDQVASDLAYHRQFGATPTEQVTGFIKTFNGYPSVKAYYTTDELPQDPTGTEGSSRWLASLIYRYNQIHSLSAKPVLGAWYWSSDRLPFLRQVKHGVDDVMVDYYPYPDATTGSSNQQSYGPISAISQIGKALKEASGNYSWFILQGFSWQAEPSTASQFDFPANAAAPDAQWMAYMGELALAGGARNLAIFSYPYAATTPGQLQQIAEAVTMIRASRWFRQ